MHLFIKNNVNGGVYTISNRYANANNTYIDEPDETQPNSFIYYIAANNVYGYAMSQPLPTSGFRFLSQEEIDYLQIMDVPDDGPTGLILEVDLHYPHELHDLSNDYLLAPEKFFITKEMLSPYAKLCPTEHILTKKLVPKLTDKKIRYALCHFEGVHSSGNATDSCVPRSTV